MSTKKEQAGKPGFILLHRSLMDKGYYMDSHYVHLWLHLLLKANYSAAEFMHGGKMINLQPGQFVTGRDKLAAETGLNPYKIERILKVFKNVQQIALQTFSKYRIITVLQWEHYQNRTANRTTCAQQVHTTKEKEQQQINIMFDQFYSNYPRKASKKKAESIFSGLDEATKLKCIDGAKAYANQCKTLNTEKRFIKHPTTWLNQGCWEDEPLTPQQGDCPYTVDEIRRFKALHASGAGLPSDFNQEYKHLITG
jgi:hypothetical protein